MYAGADTQARAGSGATALVWAADQGHAPVAQLLLDRAAEVNARDHNGFTPLVYASWQGHREMVQLLKRAGARS